MHYYKTNDKTLGYIPRLFLTNEMDTRRVRIDIYILYTFVGVGMIMLYVRFLWLFKEDKLHHIISEMFSLFAPNL